MALRPGLTGWAQIKAVVPPPDNALDIWYVRHASLAVDLKIWRHRIHPGFANPIIMQSIARRSL
jgi:lipopolysaccharide/colanic/teichoic acid biosynthesis glycosyltransferase